MQAVWRLLSSFMFAAMGFASVHFNSAELVFYRGVAGALGQAGHDKGLFDVAKSWRKTDAANLQYAGIVFAALYTLLLFGEAH